MLPSASQRNKIMEATRSGPGVLLRWPTVTDALYYRVYAARAPSPSFYELSTPCCPVLPSQEYPCCPVPREASSLQIEGLDPGILYRFRVRAIGGSFNSTVGQESCRTAHVPAAPGRPVVSATSSSVIHLNWPPPADDGGDIIRGYRIWADVPTLNATALVLVANTSAGRPVSLTYDVAPSFYERLTLLPTQRYTISVQAWNTVGGGPLSDAIELDTPAPPSAEYELALDRWVRGTIGRGQVAQHRTFVAVGTEWTRVVLQRQAWPGATLSERLAVRSSVGALHLHARAGHPPELSTISLASGPLSARESTDPLREGLSSGAASEGEVSLTVRQPPAQWLYLLVHGAALDAPSAIYDLIVQTSVEEPPRWAVDRSGGGGARQGGARGGAAADSDGFGGSPAPSPTGAAADMRHSTLAARWRYWIDPTGPTTYTDWVSARYLHPSSGDEPSTS